MSANLEKETKVWPMLWGAGWWWGVIIALGVIASVFGGMIVFGSVRTHAPRADPPTGALG